VAGKGDGTRPARGRHRSGGGGKPDPRAAPSPSAEAPAAAVPGAGPATLEPGGGAAAELPGAGPAAAVPEVRPPDAASAAGTAAELPGAKPADAVSETGLMDAVPGTAVAEAPPSAPGELVGVGGAARVDLGRANGGPATGVKTRSSPPWEIGPRTTRSDTLPDWRPEPGSFEPPAAPATPATPAAPAARAAPVARATSAALADPATPVVRATPAASPRPRPRRATSLDRLLDVRGWPLAVVLVIQAALSLRLVWSATAFLDEGEYLTVGRLELAHFLHHAPMPDVATYLSGSPIVYPPLAAIANDVGGLAGARILSLVFMLVTTTALHGVARRLMSSRSAAFFAAALFGWLGTAQFLGAFATYDAMALMLLALATWLGVRAIEADSTLRYTLLCAAGFCMALADAAKYASALFNPVVLAVVVLAAWRADGRKAGLDSLGVMVLTAALPVTVGYDLGGSSYGQGITSTTLTRAASNSSVRAVLDLSAHATGIIAVLAVLGAAVITARRPGWPTVALAWALAGAEFLAPAEQARIHTLTSLFKHVGYGAWFACVMGGYLLAEVPSWLARLRQASHDRAARASSPGARTRPRWALLAGTAIGTAAVVAAGAFGVTVANGQYGDWANSRGMVADLSRLVQPDGYYLVEDPSVVTYYLGSKVPFSHVDSTYTSFNYVDPQTHKMLFSFPAFADSIRHGYFNDVVLAFGDTYGQDQAIVQDMTQDHNYRMIDKIKYRTSYGSSYYKIWQRIPSASPRAAHRKRAARRHRRRR
jgi:Dolichyl-phosphate-mannose-protein mannosyltransferase